jgi:hypothetical protein
LSVKDLFIQCRGVDFLTPRKDLPDQRANYFIQRAISHPLAIQDIAMPMRSKKLLLTSGEFYAMEAAYMSARGGDSFALGAIMHSSPVNRKDSPHALDERQLIMLEATPTLEIHNITITSKMSGQILNGTFQLSLGGKQTRAISVNASAAAVAAAVRELLGNCGGDIGDEYDPSGNTFDCWQGVASEYRGLGSTTVSGKMCIDWRLTPIWHPSLAIVAGLDKNLCRNPTLDAVLGLWCYTSPTTKETCAVPRCSGGQLSGLVASFEDEEATGLPWTRTWDYAFGVEPRVDTGDAFCGRNSLFLPNSFGQVNRWWMEGQAGRDSMKPYATADFPYICMAYKIPPATRLLLLVYLTWKTSDGVVQYGWRSVSMTETIIPPYALNGAPKVGQWSDIKADGNWYHTCLNFHSLLDKQNSYSVDRFKFSNYENTNWVLYGTKLPGRGSSYQSNPFWIDEFSITKTRRTLFRTDYPRNVNAMPRLVSVTRTLVPGGFTWAVALTSVNCSAPPAVNFQLSTTDISGRDFQAISKRVSDHSLPMEGSISVTFGGEETNFGVYAEANEVKSRLSNLSTIRGANVYRTGSCQTGFSWLVTFTDLPGDIPELQVSPRAMYASHVGGAVVVETVNDGGLFMGPLSADYFHVAVDKANMQVWINDGAALCALNSSTESICRFDMVENLTPVVQSAELVSMPDLSNLHVQVVFVYIIRGSRFLPQDLNTSAAIEVMVGKWPCKVSEVSDDVIVCSVFSPTTAGKQVVLVKIPGKGFARGNISVAQPLFIKSVDPPSFGAMWPTFLKISGFGFDEGNVSNNKVTIQGPGMSVVECTPLNATITEVFCMTVPPSLSNLPGTLAALKRAGSSESSIRFTLQVGSSAIESFDLITDIVLEVPRIDRLVPSSGSGSGGMLLSIYGWGFEKSSKETTVNIGKTDCPIVFKNMSMLLCSTMPSTNGSFSVSVGVDGIGKSHSSLSSIFEYKFMILDVTPRFLGIGGGVQVTVAGDGFAESDTTVLIRSTSWSIYIVSLYTSLKVLEIQDVIIKFRSGENPYGYYRLRMSARSNSPSVGIPINATESMFSNLVSEFRIPGGVTVTKDVMLDGCTFRILFNSVQEVQPLFLVDSSGLVGANISVKTIRPGTLLPNGTWRIGFDDVDTKWLPLTASADQVQIAMMEKLPLWAGIKSIDVFRADDFSGPFLNRFYPRQWIVRTQRSTSEALTRNRCLNPQYIDWDPSACPETAANLYLAYFPYFWPSLLPKPGDLGGKQYLNSLQETCNLEAVSLGLVPYTCEARLLAETLPICDRDFPNPPCWMLRWSQAMIQSRQGAYLVYNLDESSAPSDTQPGYRFWKRQGQPDIGLPSLKYSNLSAGVGMQVYHYQTSGSEDFSCEIFSVNETQLVLVVPSLADKVMTYDQYLSSDVFYRPLISWRPGLTRVNQVSSQIAEEGVSTVVGLSGSGSAGWFSSNDVSSVNIDTSALEIKMADFSLELWVRLDGTQLQGTATHTVRFMASGTCLLSVIRDESRWKLFVLDDKNTSIYGSAVKVGEWTHIAVTASFWELKFYVEGMLVNSSFIRGSSAMLIPDTIVLGSGCGGSVEKCLDPLHRCFGSWLCSYTSQNQPSSPPFYSTAKFTAFEGILDWFQLYETALSSTMIKQHASFLNFVHEFDVQVQNGLLPSACSGICGLRFTAANTPIINFVAPRMGVPGGFFNIYGFFLQNASTTVRIGNNICQVLELNSAQITCKVPSSQVMGRSLLSVAQAGAGDSVGKSEYNISPMILSASPNNEVSVLGGALISMRGSGFDTAEENITISIGEFSCFVQSISQDLIICEMSRKAYAGSLTQELPILMWFGSVRAMSKCNASSSSATVVQEDMPCKVTVSAMATPRIMRVSSRDVMIGTVLMLSGENLPYNEGAPEIMIGKSYCKVRESNSTHLVCVVGLGEAGRKELTVKFSRGYALDLSAGCSSSILYSAVVDYISPSAGSVFGGQTITITGSGFSPDPSQNAIWIGSVLCSVSFANYSHLVIRIPYTPEGLHNVPSRLEQFIPIWDSCGTNAGQKAPFQRPNGVVGQCPLLLKFSAIGGPRQIRFLNTSFIQVFSSLGGTVTSSISEGDLTNLFDADPNTVWRSPDNSTTWIALDLGRVSRITSILLKWSGNFSASEYRVMTSLDCETPTVVLNRSMCWPWGTATRNLARSCGADGNQACPTTQIATLPASFPVAADRAVDGITSSNLDDKSCTHTTLIYFPWWRLDFNRSRRIRGGKIWNRNLVPERLDGFQIFVGNGSTWDNSTNILCYSSVKQSRLLYNDPFALEFNCMGNGRYLYVVIPRTEFLTLCEVQIYEFVENSCSTPAFDRRDILPLNTMARFVVIQLLGSLEGRNEYRIGDIGILGGCENCSTPTQILDLKVNSQPAICGGNNLSLCSFLTNMSPEVFSIQPSAGAEGDTVNISGARLNSENCFTTSVVIGNAPCVVLTCMASWIQCRIQNHPPGVYNVQVSVSNFGRAEGRIWFLYKSQLQTLSPSIKGLGGGFSVTVSGTGFDFSLGTRVRMCGVDSAPGLMNTTHLSFSALAGIDTTAIPRNNYLDVIVSEDVIEYSNAWCTQYLINGNLKYCVCQPEEWQCYRARYTEIQLNIQNSKSALISHWQSFGQKEKRIFACDCQGKPGVIIPDSSQLGFDLVQGYSEQWSPQTVYLRFDALDVAFNSTVLSSRLLVTPATTTCTTGSTIRIWAEADVNSKPFNPASRGSLRKRQRTSSYVDWKMIRGWQWPYRTEESTDLSVIFQEIVLLTGWRSGNSVTLILRQNMVSGGGPCMILSSEAGALYAPKLRLSAADNPFSMRNGLLSSGQNVSFCAVEVSLLNQSYHETTLIDERCRSPLRLAVSKLHPTPGSTITPVDPSLVAQTEACCKGGSRAAFLALDSDLDTSWVSQDVNPINFTVDLGENGAYVSFGGISWTRDYARQYSIMMSSDGYSWDLVFSRRNYSGDADEFTLYQQRMFRYLRILMQGPVRNDQSSFSIKEIALFGCGQRCSDCDTISKYQIMGRTCRFNGAADNMSMGFQSIEDCEYFCTQDEKCTGYQYSSIQLTGKYLCIKFVKGEIIGDNAVSSASSDGYCLKKMESKAFNNTLIVGSTLLQMEVALTPQLTKILPSIGSTAGGTRVTVIGNFMTDRLDFISIDLGGFDCKVLSWAATSYSNNRAVLCETGYCGVLNGGLKYVRTTITGLGTSVSDNNQVFWYIDAWSSHSTWGGNPPPTGCGSYKDDAQCTDSVVIPEGQVVLLDISPPRFYLILIEGKLIFHRRDIHLQVSKINLRNTYNSYRYTKY